MSDIKLFRLTEGKADEMYGMASDLEKPLQTLIENNLEALFGVRFLKTEHSTGKTHAGRIDSLGLDENNSPVILEYKRYTDENVINQGLFYLDWLLDHKAEFEQLVRKKIGDDAAERVEWSSPRVMCIASNFTKYDEHAVQQISRNIELIRYKQFGSDFMLLELVNSGAGKPSIAGKQQKATAKTETAYGIGALASANEEVRELFAALDEFALSLGDDVQRKDLKLYTAYKRIRNFTAVEFYKDKLLLHVSLNPDTVELVDGFTRDVRNVGHWGTGDLEVWVRNSVELERAKPLVKQAFEGGASSAGGQWTEEAILQALDEKHGPKDAEVARQLIEWSRKNASQINWGKGTNDGSFCPTFDIGSGYPFIPFRLYTNGWIEVLFHRMMNQGTPFDAPEKRLELLRRLNATPEANLPSDGISRRPSFRISALANADSLAKFLNAIEWAVEVVRPAGVSS